MTAAASERPLFVSDPGSDAADKGGPICPSATVPSGTTA